MSSSASKSHRGRKRSLLLSKNAAAFLEIENAFSFPWSISKYWLDKANRNGFLITKGHAHSYYFDTPLLGLYRNGVTLRVRPGGSYKSGIGQAAREEERFPNQFALKRRSLNFQAAADEIAREQFPNLKNKTIYPIVREELEGSHEWPRRISQLRIQDLPHTPWDGHSTSIGQVLENLIREKKIDGVSSANDLVLQPWVSTHVVRRRTNLYVIPGGEYNFIDLWPSPYLTDTMKSTSRYLCLEASVDRCVYRSCPTNVCLDDLMTVVPHRFARFRRLGKRDLFEYEIKSQKCAARLTDSDAMDAYIPFGSGVLAFARAYNGDKQDIMKPMRSKATTAFGLHPACQEDGPLYEAYRAGLALAP